jgi:hypothetical protein
MELAYQWDLVGDEIQDVFRTLSLAVKTQLLSLKSFVQGHSMKLPRNPKYSTNPGQRTNSLMRYLKESVSGSKMLSTCSC